MSDMGLDELMERLPKTHAEYRSAGRFVVGCHNLGLDYKETINALDSYLEYRREQEIEAARLDALLEDLWRTIIKEFRIAPLLDALTTVAEWFERRWRKP